MPFSQEYWHIGETATRLGHWRSRLFKAFLTTLIANAIFAASPVITDLQPRARDRMQHHDAWINAATHHCQQTIYMATYNDQPAEKDDIFKLLAQVPPQEVEDKDAPGACKLESYESTPTYEM